MTITTIEVASLVEELAQLREENDRLKTLIVQDYLTGLLNRRGFEQHLKREWGCAVRNRSTIALLFCDLDDFKRINTYGGYKAGDQLLRDLGARLREIPLRSTDEIARYGGDEFTVTLPDCDLAGANRIAKLVRQAANECAVSFSIGVSAVAPRATDSPGLLLSLADSAVRLAKQEGKNLIAAAKPRSAGSEVAC